MLIHARRRSYIGPARSGPVRLGRLGPARPARSGSVRLGLGYKPYFTIGTNKNKQDIEIEDKKLYREGTVEYLNVKIRSER